jgi:anti-anti-sigma factor
LCQLGELDTLAGSVEDAVRLFTHCTMAHTPYRLLQASTEQDVLVLTITEPQVEGDEVAQVLKQEMLAAAEAASLHKAVVDLRNARYISSVAFGPLLALRRKLQEENGRLMVCGLSATVGDVFYTTLMVSPTGNFTAPFELQTDVTSAVAALSGLAAPS